MGRGIAQISAAAGYQTYLFDQNLAQAKSARDSILDQWTKLVAKRKLTSEEFEIGKTHLHVVESIEALGDSDLVVEAIVESLEAKQNLFRALETVVKSDCILATNTSSLSVTAVSRPLSEPSRFAGLHFFNPVPLMRVTEVIGGLSTDPAVLELLNEFVSKIGHKPVRAKDTPGFIVNHAGRGYGTEALKIAGEDVADFATIDLVLREVCGFRMDHLSCWILQALTCRTLSWNPSIISITRNHATALHQLRSSALTADISDVKRVAGFTCTNPTRAF